MDVRQASSTIERTETEEKSNKAAIIALLTKIVPNSKWDYTSAKTTAWALFPKAIAPSVFEFICYAFETYPFSKFLEGQAGDETMLASKYGVEGGIQTLATLKESKGIYIKPISGKDKDLYSALLTVSQNPRLSDLRQHIKEKSKENDLIVRIIIDKFEGKDRFIELETTEYELRNEIAKTPFQFFCFEKGPQVEVPSLEFERELNQLAGHSFKKKSITINFPKRIKELNTKLEDILGGKSKEIMIVEERETKTLEVAIQVSAEQLSSAFEKFRAKNLFPKIVNSNILIELERAYKVLIYGDELLKRVKETFTAETNEKFKWVLDESRITMRMVYPKQKEDEKNKKIIALLEKMMSQLKANKIFSVLEETSVIADGGYRISVPIEQSLSASAQAQKKEMPSVVPASDFESMLIAQLSESGVTDEQTRAFLAEHQSALTSATADTRSQDKEHVTTPDADIQKPIKRLGV